MSRSHPPADRRGEPGHPHGWLGYIVADPDRTTNVLRLARGLAPVAITALLVTAATLVVITMTAPVTAAGLLAGATTAGGLTTYARHRTHTRRSTRFAAPKPRP